MKRILAVLLTTLPAYAEPPFLPLVVCSNGVCTMTQKDWEEMQAFHVRVINTADAIQQANGELEQQLAAQAIQNKRLKFRCESLRS